MSMSDAKACQPFQQAPKSLRAQAISHPRDQELATPGYDHSVTIDA
jgi:hypothetical protein